MTRLLHAVIRPGQAALRTQGMAALVVACAIAIAPASCVHAEWKKYRSEDMGYELSYPPEMELKVFFGGRSGELRDATTGERQIELEVWPADLCPRHPQGTTPKSIGVNRAMAITQADGPGSSSACGEPVTVRKSVTGRGVQIYELGLTCVRERYEDDDEHPEKSKLVREVAGRKGPTFFADISQSWRARVLTVDPVGVDPRLKPARHQVESAVVRKILETIATFPLPKPDAVCIEDMR